MSYIGRGVDAISNVEKLDNITFSGTTTYALTKSSAAFTPVGANNILISIDGVIQQGNFSVSTTNIVFDWSPTSANTCNWIMHFGTGVLNVPADGSIVAAKMAANSVDSASYVDGSIDEVHMSANSIDSDSYVDASIDNAHLADDAVGVAELSATGTASSSTFLRGDNAWASAGGGKVGQVVTAHFTTAASFSSSSTNTFVDLGITLAITPTATSSKIFIMSTTHIAENTSGTMHIRLLRDSSVINLGTSLGGSQLGSMTGWRDETGTMYSHALVNKTNHYLDSPSSTSELTYKLQGTLGASYSGTYYIGRSTDDTDADFGPRWPSNLTAWEILA